MEIVGIENAMEGTTQVLMLYNATNNIFQNIFHKLLLAYCFFSALTYCLPFTTKHLSSCEKKIVALNNCLIVEFYQVTLRKSLCSRDWDGMILA